MRRLLPFLALTLLTGTARADIAPDPDSPDAHCTLAEECPDGVECPYGIRQEAGVAQACADTQKAGGLEYRCHRGGNYLGTAIYCRHDARGSWSPPAAVANQGSPAASRKGCALSPGEAPTESLAIAGVALGLLLVRRTARDASRRLASPPREHPRPGSRTRTSG